MKLWIYLRSLQWYLSSQKGYPQHDPMTIESLSKKGPNLFLLDPTAIHTTNKYEIEKLLAEVSIRGNKALDQSIFLSNVICMKGG